MTGSPGQGSSPSRGPDLRSILTSTRFAGRADDVGEVADRELEARPPFTIRMRLILALGVFFLLYLLLVIWAIGFLSRIHEKVLFLEVANLYTAEIQQARRFEKNYLLYGTNLEDAVEHARRARDLARTHGGRFESVAGPEQSRVMSDHVARYLRLLDDIARAPDRAARGAIEREIRDHGAAMVRLAIECMERERRGLDRMLYLARRVPWIFLGVLLLLMVLAFNFVARPIVGALSRFMTYAERIGRGDFTPITPARKYRDEFSKLALTLNRMMRAVDRQHRILVESHKMRAMGNLVAGVAHELNNPLNNILLTACLLREEGEALDETEREEMLEDLVSQSDRAKRIVQNLLDYARETESKLEALDLAAIIDHTLRLAGNQIRMKKVRMTLELPEDLPPVHGDRQLLGQVFLNLILNALDVLPEKGEIRIRAETGRQEGFLAVDVSDNGPGIPEHVLDRIFDPFFTTKPQGRGTGLGLAVSHGIMNKLGGDLLVRSTPGRGATFTVLLPVTTIPGTVSSPGGGPGGEEAG